MFNKKVSQVYFGSFVFTYSEKHVIERVLES